MEVNFTNSISQHISRQRIVAVLAVGFMLLPLCSRAQLYVKENTQIAVKGVLTSQQEVNNIQASLQGEGTLVLDGDKQQLYTAPGVWLHNLRITRATGVAINTPLHLRGDLVIDSGNLQLIYTLHIAGDVQLGDDATLQDGQLIHYLKSVPGNDVVHGNETLLVPHGLCSGIITTAAAGSTPVIYARVQPVTMHAAAVSRLGNGPPLPPPEWVQA